MSMNWPTNKLSKKKVISKEEDFSDWDVTLGDGLEDED